MVAKMQSVELFRAGRYPVLDHRTKQWTHKEFTERHLDEMVENFRRFQTPGPDRQHKLKMVKGHTLYDPSAPNDGELSKIYRDGPVLKFDAGHVDAGLAAEIKNKRFDDLSAEIYESPAEAGLSGRGMMLRRVAILGADVPKVKGLNPAGLDQTLRFSENPKTGFTIFVFSEGAMGRDELMKALLAKGMPQEVLDTLDDVQLTAIVQVCGQAAPAPDPAQQQPAGGAAAMPPEMPEEKEAAAVQFSEYAQQFATKYKAKFNEELPQSRGLAITFSEADLLKAVESVAGPIRANLSAAAVEAKRQRVQLFCENELNAGRILPAELDAGAGPTLVDRLLATDDASKVHKFSEGGRTIEMTALDAEMRAIRQRPAFFSQNGKKIPAANGNGQTTNFSESDGHSADEQRIMKFAEANADDLAKISGEPETIVKEYTETFKKASREQKAEMLRLVSQAGY